VKRERVKFGKMLAAGWSGPARTYWCESPLVERDFYLAGIFFVSELLGFFVANTACARTYEYFELDAEIGRL